MILKSRPPLVVGFLFTNALSVYWLVTVQVWSCILRIKDLDIRKVIGYDDERVNQKFIMILYELQITRCSVSTRTLQFYLLFEVFRITNQDYTVNDQPVNELKKLRVERTIRYRHLSGQEEE